MKETILDIFAGVMPTVIICIIIAVSLRVTYLIRNKKKFHIIETLSHWIMIYLSFLCSNVSGYRWFLGYV